MGLWALTRVDVCQWVDAFITILFTIDYLLRLCVRRRRDAAAQLHALGALLPPLATPAHRRIVPHRVTPFSLRPLCAGHWRRYAADNRLVYPFTFHAVVDLCTIMPVYLELVVVNNLPPFAFLRFVRVLRIMRILRAFKLLNATMSGAWVGVVGVRVGAVLCACMLCCVRVVCVCACAPTGASGVREARPCDPCACRALPTPMLTQAPRRLTRMHARSC